MNEALVPLYVMGAFLVLMVALLLLAVRTSRRGLTWSDDEDETPPDV